MPRTCSSSRRRRPTRLERSGAAALSPRTSNRSTHGCPCRRRYLALPGCSLAALAAGGLLLRRRAALGGVAARAGLLAAAARRARRVGDLRRSLLRHPLVLQGLVLLLVLDVCSFIGHAWRFPRCKSDETNEPI